MSTKTEPEVFYDLRVKATYLAGNVTVSYEPVLSPPSLCRLCSTQPCEPDSLHCIGCNDKALDEEIEQRSEPHFRRILRAVEAARAVYDTFHGVAGCCLHVVLVDGNVEDQHLLGCRKEAVSQRHPLCLATLDALEPLSANMRRLVCNVK